MTTKAMNLGGQPDAIDLRILEMASEQATGAHGRSLSGIYQVMDEVATREEVKTSLDVLEENKLLTCTPRGRRQSAYVDVRIVITTKGSDYLRRLKAKEQFNIRPPSSLVEKLRAMTKPGESPASLAVWALDEWIRMNEFPGIDFRVTPTGRQPHVTGTGMTVWETSSIWKDHGENMKKLLYNYPHLRAAQIQASARYAKEYWDERPKTGFGTKPPFAHAGGS